MDGYLAGDVFILEISLGEGMGMGMGVRIEMEMEMEMERGWGTGRYLSNPFKTSVTSMIKLVNNA